MKIITAIFGVVLLCASCGKKPAAQSGSNNSSQSLIKTSELRIRDPFIYVDKESKTYYVTASNGGKGFKMYKSKDLENWKDLGVCFEPKSDFWGKKEFWAPDLYQHQGRYYIFGTFSGEDGMRGTSVLVADEPEGPYEPLINKSTTPADWMALDGALYIDDNNQHWMLYCHEWVQIGDGAIVAQRISDDFKELIGEPKVLFTASSAPWTKPLKVEQEGSYVTDAPVIYKTPGGRLVMLWSSFGDEYHVAASYSENGLLGPWVHDEKPLNNDDGGHAMLFTDLNDVLKISYHSPNSKTETATIREVGFDVNDKIYLK